MEENRDKTLNFIENAASQGAKLIVLPELCVSGYVFNSRDEALKSSELIPNGESLKAWDRICKEKGIYLIAGLAERDNEALYNTSVLIGPNGYMGKYRKLHLWFEEKFFFEPGNLSPPLFNTPFGRVAMMICYDMWFPEIPRIHSLNGADLLVIPTNWPEHPTRERVKDITDKIIVTHSCLNKVFTAACDRVGTERGTTFKGRSIITGTDGSILAGPASRDKEEIIIAECNLMDSRIKSTNNLNNVIWDRRSDIYHLT
jgi:predicted amidohydrolase